MTLGNLYLSGGSVRFDASTDEGTRRLRESLGQLLQVNQLCLFLGAGASFHLGSPRIRSVSADYIVEIAEAAGAPIRDARRDLLDVLVEEPINLEGLLSMLATTHAYAVAAGRTAVELGTKSWSAEDVSQLLHSVNIGLARACELPPTGTELDPPFDGDPWYSHREFFRRILGARRPDAPRVKVFTVNYDTVIEKTLDDAGIAYLDGFVGGVRRTLNLAIYDTDIFMGSPVARGSLLRVPDVVHLFKLHGSLNWRVEASPSGFGSRRVVQVAGTPSEGELALIYPTPAKEVDVLGHPYADLLRLFGSAVSTPETALIVLGYGFADDHINRLIFQAMANNSSLQLLVADPFGVVNDEVTEKADAPVFLDTPLGRLAAVEDARISIVTGEIAKFTSFASHLPDVADRSIDQQRTLEAELSAAFFPRDPPAPAGL